MIRGQSSGWQIGQRPRTSRGGGSWWWAAWCGPARRNGIVDTRAKAEQLAQRAERDLLERARRQDTRDLLSPRPDPDWL